MEPEATKQYLDMEAAAPNHLVSSITGQNPSVKRRWALLGTVGAFLLMTIVVARFGGATGTKVSARKSATALTNAFAPSVFAAPGIRPMIGHGQKLAQRPAAGLGQNRVRVAQYARRPAVVRGTPLRMAVNDQQAGAPDYLMQYFADMDEGALKKLLIERGVNTDGCSNKEQLLALAEENRDLLKGQGTAIASEFFVKERLEGTPPPAPDFAEMKAGALKTLLTASGVSTEGMFEKEELLNLAEQNRDFLTSSLKRKKERESELKGPPPAPTGEDADPANREPEAKTNSEVEVERDQKSEAGAEPDTKAKPEGTRSELLDFAGMRAGALKELLVERGVATQDCFDKDQLVERAEQNRDILEGPAPAATRQNADPVQSGPPPGAGAAVNDQKGPAEPVGSGHSGAGAAGKRLDFSGMRAGTLKTLLTDRGIPTTGCLDKEGLVERAEMYRHVLDGPPPVPTWGGPDPVEQGPSGDDATASLILLHGFGDTGSGFISQMGGPLVAMDGMRVVFPSAPRAKMGGIPVSSWLQGQSMMQSGPTDVQVSVDYVHALIRREVARGVPADRIVIGGFSQGGLIATRAALSFPDAALGGVLALSTFIGSDDAPVADANKKLRVLVAHGEDDPAVPVSEGKRLAKVVGRLAPMAPVKLATYPGMGHSTCPDEVRDIREFLQMVSNSASNEADVKAETRSAASGAKPEVGSNVQEAEVVETGAKAEATSVTVPATDASEREAMEMARKVEQLEGFLKQAATGMAPEQLQVLTKQAQEMAKDPQKMDQLQSVIKEAEKFIDPQQVQQLQSFLKNFRSSP